MKYRTLLLFGSPVAAKAPNAEYWEGYQACSLAPAAMSSEICAPADLL
jgi:hypothetical protein